MAGSLWSVPSERVLDEALRLTEAGLRTLHWDVTDGDFALAGGFLPHVAAAVSTRTGASAEAHLMVHEPNDYVDAWTEFCEIVTVHAEAHDWRAAVERIARRGSIPAVALSPGTSGRALGSEGLAVLVMSVSPGRGGTAFDVRALSTVASLGPRELIGVDGGVTVQRALSAIRAGATWIISGSDLLGHRDPAAWIAAVSGAGQS